MISGHKLGKILQEMQPMSEDEWESLRHAVEMAASMHQFRHSDEGLRMLNLESDSSFMPGRPQVTLEPSTLLNSMPREQQHYFYALMEALEVYQSIHGRPLTAEALQPHTLTELKKIRDMCLRRGLRPY